MTKDRVIGKFFWEWPALPHSQKSLRELRTLAGYGYRQIDGSLGDFRETP